MSNTNLKFGDEIEPISKFNDTKKRKYIFMSWMGGKLSGSARVAVVFDNGESFDPQGVWVKGFGLVLQYDAFCHNSTIKKKRLTIWQRIRYFLPIIICKLFGYKKY